MILPELSIPTSIDLFDTNLKVFFNKYISNEDSQKLTYSRTNFSYKGLRYSIYFDKEKPDTSQQTLIGEIDAVMVHNNRTDIRAAVYQIQDIKDGLRFFDDFYFMIFSKWEIEFNVELLNCKRGNGATMEWVGIGWRTNYFCLPDVHSEMFYENDCNNDILKYSPGELEIFKYLPESVQEEIRQEYEHKINQRLPEFPQTIDQISDNLEYGNERIKEIVEQIPDRNNDRKILRMWLEGYSAIYIADKIDRAPQTVHNIISNLRCNPKIGPLVPLDKDRIKKRKNW